MKCGENGCNPHYYLVGNKHSFICKKPGCNIHEQHKDAKQLQINWGKSIERKNKYSIKVTRTKSEDD